MDYYQLLGLKKNSSTDEIKKIYRKLAIIYHPDKHNDEQKTEHFKKITQAYETLSDPILRKDYDLNLYLQDEERYGSDYSYEFTEEDYKLIQIYYDKCTQSVEFKFIMSLFSKLPNETKDKMFQKVNIKEILKKFTKTRLLNLNKIKVIDVSKLFEDITIHLNISFEKLYNGFCEEIQIKGLHDTYTFFVTSSNYSIHFRNNIQSRITIEFRTTLKEFFTNVDHKLIYTLPINLYEYYFMKEFLIPLPQNDYKLRIENIKNIHIIEDLGFYNPQLKKRDLLLVKFKLELNPISDKYKNIMKEIFDR